MHPLFTIITVTYNAEATLPATLKSVSEQTFSMFEYLIIDGKSADSSVRLAREASIPNCKIVSEPDGGLYDAMNKGLGMAQGDYVIFLNAGDTFHTPVTLEHIADAVLENDYPGVVYGQTDIVDSSRNKLRDRHLRAPEVLTTASFSDGMVVCHQAFIVLRKIAGNYLMRFKYSSDYEWCIRCLQRSHRNLYIDEVLIDFLSEGMTSRHHLRSLIERFRIMIHYYGLFPTLLTHFKKVFKKITNL